MSEADSFFTLSSTAEGHYKEKGSKFLAFATPVDNENAVKQKLEELRKTYYDARHHCYAYILGSRSEKHRANDDGEPNHSAGDPILGQIRSRQLTNTLVVVVRYFGGTKLGVPGLVNAYKTAAQEALANAETVEVPIRDTIAVSFPYDKTSDVMRLLKEFETNIVDQAFAENCRVTVAIRIGTGEQLKEKLALAGVLEVEIVPTPG